LSCPSSNSVNCCTLDLVGWDGWSLTASHIHFHLISWPHRPECEQQHPTPGTPSNQPGLGASFNCPYRLLGDSSEKITSECLLLPGRLIKIKCALHSLRPRHIPQPLLVKLVYALLMAGRRPPPPCSHCTLVWLRLLVPLHRISH
jgi:hypothetical protein